MPAAADISKSDFRLQIKRFGYSVDEVMRYVTVATGFQPCDGRLGGSNKMSQLRLCQVSVVVETNYLRS